MWVLINVILWPLGAVAIHLLQPLLFPGEPAPSIELLAGIALVGMLSCLLGAAVKRTLGPKPPGKQTDRAES